MKKCVLALLAVSMMFAGCASKPDDVQKPAETAPAQNQAAWVRPQTLQTIDAVVVGDRVLDVMNALGYQPKAMAIRASQWPRSKQFAAKLLGCPNKVIKNEPGILPAVIKELSLTSVILEDNNAFCSLMTSVNPAKAAPLVKDTAAKTTIIDCSGTPEQIIANTAAFLGKEKEGTLLIADYTAKLNAAQKRIPLAASGKRVVDLQ